MTNNDNQAPVSFLPSEKTIGEKLSKEMETKKALSSYRSPEVLVSNKPSPFSNDMLVYQDQYRYYLQTCIINATKTSTNVSRTCEEFVKYLGMFDYGHGESTATEYFSSGQLVQLLK